MTESHRSPDFQDPGLDPLDCLPVAVYVDEIDDSGAIHLAFNSVRYGELTGFVPDTFADDAWAWDEQIHPEDLPAYQRSFDRLWHELADQDIDYRFRRRDGRWVWLHDRATATRDDARHITVINGVLSDVTARREAEIESARVREGLEHLVLERTEELERTVEQLRASEAGLRHAQALASVGSFEWWTVTGVLRGSDEMYEIFGIPAGSAVDIASLREAAHPEDTVRLDEALRRALQGDPPPAFEVRVMRGDELRHLDVRMEAVHDEHGDLVCLRGTAQDMTARKQAEEQIHNLNARLNELVARRTEQLDAATGELESLAYSISHEVRAPLRTIEGFSAIVLEDAGDRLGEDDLAHLRRIESAARRMRELVNDLLGLSRVSRRDLHRERCDLARIAADVCDELRAEQPQREMRVTIEEDLVADADPALVRVVLRSLLDNAWKFTEPHGAAVVEVAATDGEDGERVFYVRDDGVGFDMRYAGHLFGAFQRLHPSDRFEGNGIGLATVQRLVRRHGGRCWAEAEPGAGATFFFTLPAPA